MKSEKRSYFHAHRSHLGRRVNAEFFPSETIHSLYSQTLKPEVVSGLLLHLKMVLHVTDNTVAGFRID